MRISDWSSDVCSSDLSAKLVDRLIPVSHDADVAVGLGEEQDQLVLHRVGVLVLVDQHVLEAALVVLEQVWAALQELHGVAERSEEHTSELQSLMRISYAVFCLTKKKITNNQPAAPLIIKNTLIACSNDHQQPSQ